MDKHRSKKLVVDLICKRCLQRSEGSRLSWSPEAESTKESKAPPVEALLETASKKKLSVGVTSVA